MKKTGVLVTLSNTWALLVVGLSACSGSERQAAVPQHVLPDGELVSVCAPWDGAGFSARGTGPGERVFLTAYEPIDQAVGAWPLSPEGDMRGPQASVCDGQGEHCDPARSGRFAISRTAGGTFKVTYTLTLRSGRKASGTFEARIPSGRPQLMCG